jgi:hypothetical protein
MTIRPTIYLNSSRSFKIKKFVKLKWPPSYWRLSSEIKQSKTLCVILHFVDFNDRWWYENHCLLCSSTGGGSVVFSLHSPTLWCDRSSSNMTVAKICFFNKIKLRFFFSLDFLPVYYMIYGSLLHILHRQLSWKSRSMHVIYIAMRKYKYTKKINIFYKFITRLPIVMPIVYKWNRLDYYKPSKPTGAQGSSVMSRKIFRVMPCQYLKFQCQCQENSWHTSWRQDWCQE